MSLGPVVLSGGVVRLEPLRLTHVDALLAAGGDRSIWSWMPAKISSREAMTQFVNEALSAEARGAEYAFAVIELASGRAIGSTRYIDVSEAHKGVEIGWTWYAPEVWGTRVNPECKLLLMQHAFETWGAIRVMLKTDHMNERSQKAILKLGATFEGRLRNHRIRPDGTLRDTMQYSITNTDWPGVKAGLQARLKP